MSDELKNDLGKGAKQMKSLTPLPVKERSEADNSSSKGPRVGESLRSNLNERLELDSYEPAFGGVSDSFAEAENAPLRTSVFGTPADENHSDAVNQDHDQTSLTVNDIIREKVSRALLLKEGRPDSPSITLSVEPDTVFPSSHQMSLAQDKGSQAASISLSPFRSPSAGVHTSTANVSTAKVSGEQAGAESIGEQSASKVLPEASKPQKTNEDQPPHHEVNELSASSQIFKNNRNLVLPPKSPDLLKGNKPSGQKTLFGAPTDLLFADNAEEETSKPTSDSRVYESLELDENAPFSAPKDKDGTPLGFIYFPKSEIRKYIINDKHPSLDSVYDSREQVYLSEDVSSRGSLASTVNVEDLGSLKTYVERLKTNNSEQAFAVAKDLATYLEKSPQSIEGLESFFPGPKDTDWSGYDPQKVSTHGPLLYAISKLELVGANFMIRFLRDPNPEKRIAAMRLLHELVPSYAVKSFAPQLLDINPDVRFYAKDILLKEREHPNFDKNVLSLLRSTLRDENASIEKLTSAAQFLGTVLDPQAVEPGVDLLKRSHTAEEREVAKILLKELTLQDYRDINAWETWLSEHPYRGKYTRIFWLIDALNDEQLLVREAAFGQLKNAFGPQLKNYLPTHPEPARRRARNGLHVQFQTLLKKS